MGQREKVLLVNAVLATLLLLAAAQDVPPGSAGQVTSLRGTCWLERGASRPTRIDMGNEYTTSLFVDDIVRCDEGSSLDLTLNGLKTTIESDPDVGTRIQQITRPRSGIVSDPVDSKLRLGGLLVSAERVRPYDPSTRVAASPGGALDDASLAERFRRQVRGVEWTYFAVALALVALAVLIMARRDRTS